MKRQDPQLGDLIWNPVHQWWEGSVSFCMPIVFELYVHTPPEALQAITDGARAAFEAMRRAEDAARQFAAEQLLGVHNDGWNEDEEIEADEFMNRLVPTMLELFPNGDAEISFDDDDLFLGHVVTVRFRRGQFTEAVLAG